MNRRQLTWPSGEAVVVAEGQEQIAAAGGAGAGAGACVTGGGLSVVTHVGKAAHCKTTIRPLCYYMAGDGVPTAACGIKVHITQAMPHTPFA